MIRKAFVETAGSENVASAEAKVKIAAAPKAPKATVDYKKGVVTIPNKTEYKVIYASGENDSALTTEASATMAETAAWKPVSTKASLSPKNILKESGITDPETQDKLLESGFIIAIRTAYDGQKKKAASSINFVTIGKTAKSETIEGEDGIKVGDATFKWAFGDNGKVKFTASNGVFEYADSEDSTRWTKVSGSKTVSVTSGTTIYVRRMGDKASSLLPSDITPVKLEKAEKPAAVANVTVSVKDGESTTVTLFHALILPLPTLPKLYTYHSHPNFSSFFSDKLQTPKMRRSLYPPAHFTISHILPNFCKFNSINLFPANLKPL